MRKAGHLAPCPCCHLHYPKYGKNGKIAYFPNEQVVRMLGPDCFARLNPEEHERANTVFQAEKRRTRSLQYLGSQLHKVPILIEAIKANFAIAQAVDDFQLDLLLRLDKCLNTQMWSHVRDNGQLKVFSNQSVTRKKADGTEETFEQQTLVSFSVPLIGYQIIERKPRSFAKRLKSAVTKLEKVDFVEASGRLNELNDEDLERATKSFSSGYRIAKSSLDMLQDFQRFLGAMNLAVLKGWNSHEGCPIRIFIDLDGHNLTVGRSENNRQRFTVAPEYFHVLKQLPSVSEMTVNEMAAEDKLEEVA